MKSTLLCSFSTKLEFIQFCKTVHLRIQCSTVEEIFLPGLLFSTRPKRRIKTYSVSLIWKGTCLPKIFPLPLGSSLPSTDYPRSSSWLNNWVNRFHLCHLCRWTELPQSPWRAERPWGRKGLSLETTSSQSPISHDQVIGVSSGLLPLDAPGNLGRSIPTQSSWPISPNGKGDYLPHGSSSLCNKWSNQWGIKKLPPWWA